MKGIETREIDGQKYDLMEAGRNLLDPCGRCVFYSLGCLGRDEVNACAEENIMRRFWRKHKETV